MSSESLPEVGSILWRDLTVANAEEIRDFYSHVVGWKATPHDMEEYVDYDIHPPGSEDTIAGICHARGENAKIPPVWLMYIVVADVDESARRCVELGGSLIDGPRGMGGYRFCVIRDPAGAIAALISQKPLE